MAHDLLGHAAEEEVRDAAPPVGAHHEHAGLELGRDGEQLGRRIALAEHGPEAARLGREVFDGALGGGRDLGVEGGQEGRLEARVREHGDLKDVRDDDLVAHGSRELFRDLQRLDRRFLKIDRYDDDARLLCHSARLRLNRVGASASPRKRRVARGAGVWFTRETSRAPGSALGRSGAERDRRARAAEGGCSFGVGAAIGYARWAVDMPLYMRSTLVKAFAVTVMDDSRGEGKVAVGEPPAAVALPQVEDVVGGLYRLVRVLGEGAFGKVYMAQRLDVPEHQVALKILPRSVYEGRNVERELVMLATVGHPHVVQLKDHGTGPDFVWLTMPVYEGETLGERLARGPLTMREAYDIFVPVARGLEALHGAGLRHQDIKPENIYLAVFGGRVHPILLDLGVAAEREATFVAGTMIFAAPEQVAAFESEPGSIPLSEKMDTYALGATILIALTGPDAFPGINAATPDDIREAHRVRATRPLGEGLLPGLRGRPRELLEAALRRWLALDAKERPSMSDLASELEVLLEPEREEARAEELRRMRQRTSMQRIRMTAVALLLALAGGGYFVYSKRTTIALASELDKARREGAESFDKLDTCVASHNLANSAVSTCRSERQKDQAECRASMDAMKKAGSSSAAEAARQIEQLHNLYGGRLKACEDAEAAALKKAADEKAQAEAAFAKERAQLVSERDEQKKLADARAQEIAALKGEREACEASKQAVVSERDACKAAAVNAASTAGPPIVMPAGGTSSPGGPPPPANTSPSPGPTSSPTSQPASPPAPPAPPGGDPPK